VVLDFLFQRLASFMTAFTLSVALGVMGSQVVFRYALNDSLYWAEEVARYALVWSSMIGAAVAYREGGHVAVTDLIRRLPRPVQAGLNRTIHLIVLLFSIFLAWQGWSLMLRNFARNQLSTALEMPIAWVQLAIPVGAALIALAALEALVRGAHEPPETHQG